jgi:uncharacterized protein YkwD
MTLRWIYEMLAGLRRKRQFAWKGQKKSLTARRTAMQRQFLLAIIALAVFNLISAWDVLPANGQTMQPALEQSILRQVNDYRRTLTKADLRFDQKLSNAARAYARRLAQMETTVMSHTHDGKNPATRVREAGYLAGLGGVGENIAWSMGRPQPANDAVRMWRESPPHHAAMTSSTYNETGVGVCLSESGKYYFCQVFAHANTSASQSTNVNRYPQDVRLTPPFNSPRPAFSGGNLTFPAGLPDLAAANFRLVKQLAPATTVKPYEASAVIKNVGTTMAATVDYAVYSIDWSKQSVRRIKHAPLHPMPRGLAPGQSVTLHFHVDVPTGAAVTVFLKADPDNRLRESNELNNHAYAPAMFAATSR